MNDVTDKMLQFKEAIRHIWNVNFALVASNQSPDIQDAYDTICEGLLIALVLRGTVNAVERAEHYRNRPLSFLVVRPVEHLQLLPMRIGELDAANNTVFSEATSVEVDEESRIEFYDFFSWNHRAYVDLPYVRAKIAALSSAPSAVGRVVLIEQQHCRFFLDDE